MASAAVSVAKPPQEVVMETGEETGESAQQWLGAFIIVFIVLGLAMFALFIYKVVTNQKLWALVSINTFLMIAAWVLIAIYVVGKFANAPAEGQVEQLAYGAAKYISQSVDVAIDTALKRLGLK